jgi:hypothetical protein
MNNILFEIYHRMPYPVRVLAASLRGWYLRGWRYGAATEKHVQEALAREHWSDRQWQVWREERLALILHRAATRVPYYRTHWEHRRRNGDRAAWEYLENWPILERKHCAARHGSLSRKTAPRPPCFTSIPAARPVHRAFVVEP